MTAIDVDFGTSNSSIGCVNASREVGLCRFPSISGVSEAYRSLLYLERVRQRGMAARRVDRVFLTGGSSFVVAWGLGLKALDDAKTPPHARWLQHLRHPRG